MFLQILEIKLHFYHFLSHILEKIYEYKQNFKTILADEELAIVYGIKKNEPVKAEKAKLPVTNNAENIQKAESNIVDIKKEETSVENIQNIKPKKEKKKVDLTIKK